MLSALFELVGYLVAEAVGAAVSEAWLESRHRRRFSDGKVGSDLRSAQGRVYNIGTEWSAGIATVTAGHISFEPSLGIVGKREINIDRAGTARRARERRNPTKPHDTIVVLVTPKGELEWSLETRHVRAVMALLELPVASTDVTA